LNDGFVNENEDIEENTDTYVAVDGRIKSRFTANAIIKQCGIDFRFV